MPTADLGDERVLHVFATGSTMGPLRRAAQAFVLLNGDSEMEVTVAGASKLFPRMIEWKEGDLVCGGSESTMDRAIMYGVVLARTLRPLGARPAAILVPNGNPAEVKGTKDLGREDVRVGMVYQGSLEGVWEEVALRAGLFEAIRERVRTVAEGSSDLLGILARREVDASIGWESMALLAPEKIEALPIREEWRCWRTTGIGITPWCQRRELAEQFIHFLRSPEGGEIWQKFGWMPLRAARVVVE